MFILADRDAPHAHVTRDGVQRSAIIAEKLHGDIVECRRVGCPQFGVLHGNRHIGRDPNQAGLVPGKILPHAPRQFLAERARRGTDGPAAFAHDDSDLGCSYGGPCVNDHLQRPAGHVGNQVQRFDAAFRYGL